MRSPLIRHILQKIRAILLITALTLSGASNTFASAYSHRDSAEPLGTKHTYPLTPFEIVTPYDPPAQNWLPGHRGIDVNAKIGQPVTAIADAHVHFAGQVAGRGVLTLILSNKDLVSIEPIDPSVMTGDFVAQGANLGVIAQAGQEHCKESICAHIGLRREGQYLNPLLLWRELRPQIILLQPR